MSYYPNQGYGAPRQGYGAPQGYPQQGGQYLQPGMQQPGGMGGMGVSMVGAPPPTFQGWATQYYYQLKPQELQELKQWFVSVDRDRSQSISVHELQNLAFGGIPLGFDNALKLIKVFDRDFSGTIDFYEYASLHKFIQAMQAAFIRADQNRNSQLDAAEIHNALLSSGFQLQIHAVQALFRKYARGRTGIGFGDFLGLASDIALLRSKFEWADSRRSGYISITLDQLITMAADL
mmetsp:Transcript_26300/g.73512  ORF Transcript_26300/g.73512 Transcript_26300/m.73512 type:complete len:234 (+) Transcript_26300:83-784(+)